MYDVKANSSILCLLYVASYSVNKYVLSVMKFQYPTIFQGWQTLFGCILLTMLQKIGSVQFEESQLNLKACVSWSPYLLSFVVSIYSGSVALSQLPVAVFMSFHNNITVFQLLLDRFLLSNKVINATEYVVVTIILISSLFISQGDIEVNQKAYVWMLVHVASSSFLIGFPRVKSSLPTLSATSRLYVSYLTSALMLLPSTLLLGDAMAATQFAFWYYYSFYLSCVLSGIFGVYLNLSLIDLHEKPHSYSVTFLLHIPALAKLCVSVVSFVLFPEPLWSTTVMWCLVNLCSATLLTNLQPQSYSLKNSLSDPEFQTDDFILQV